ncbi:MAG: methionyl-tRNA formyltransferase [Dehalococcoidia bacterium]
MGTPEFALPALERLAEAGFEVMAVYTQPDRPSGRGRRMNVSPVKRWATARGLRVITPTTFKSPDSVSQLRALEPELIVVAAYGKLLPASVLEVPPKGVVNIHPSLLPRHRGASPVAAAILAGDGRTGVTIMLLDAGMDKGPILAQRPEPVADDDTTASLTQRLAKLGADLLVETLPLWLDGSIEAVAQDEAQATVCPKLTATDGEIDWQWSAEMIERRIRAFDPWPGCYTVWRGKRLKLTRARAVDWEGGQPGTVVRLEKMGPAVRRGGEQGVGIATGQGLLVVRELQPEGKRPMTAQEFLAGHGGFEGDRLPS